MFVPPLYDSLNGSKANIDTQNEFSSVVTCQFCLQLLHASDLEMHILNVHLKGSRKMAQDSVVGSKVKLEEIVDFSLKPLSNVPVQNLSLFKDSIPSDLPHNKLLSNFSENQNLTEVAKTASDPNVNAFDACMDFLNNDKNFNNIFQDISSLEQTETLLPFMMQPDQQMFFNPNISNSHPKSDSIALPLPSTGYEKNCSLVHTNMLYESGKANQNLVNQSDYNVFQSKGNNPSTYGQVKSEPQFESKVKTAHAKRDMTFIELADMIKATLADGGNLEMESEDSANDFTRNNLTGMPSSSLDSNPENVQSCHNLCVNEKVNDSDSTLPYTHKKNKANLISKHDDAFETSKLSQKVKLMCGHCDKKLSSVSILKKHTTRFHPGVLVKFSKVLVLNDPMSPQNFSHNTSFSKNENFLNISKIINMTEACEKKQETDVSQTHLPTSVRNSSLKTKCEICKKTLTVSYLKYHMKSQHADALRSVQEIKLEPISASDPKCDIVCKSSGLDSTKCSVSNVQEQDIDSSTCLSVSDALQRNASFSVTDAKTLCDKKNVPDDSSMQFNFNDLEFPLASPSGVKNKPSEKPISPKKLKFVKSEVKLEESEINSLKPPQNNTKSGLFPCNLCSKVLHFRGNLNRHLKKQHNLLPEKVKREIHSGKPSVVGFSKVSLPLNSNKPPKVSKQNNKSGTCKIFKTKQNLLKTVLHSNFVSKQFPSEGLASVKSINSGDNAQEGIDSVCVSKPSNPQENSALFTCNNDSKDLDPNGHELQSNAMLSNVSGPQPVEKSVHDSSFMPNKLPSAFENENSDQRKFSSQADLSACTLYNPTSEPNSEAEVDSSSIVMPISEIISNVSKCTFGSTLKDPVSVYEAHNENSLKLKFPSPEKSANDNGKVPALFHQAYESGDMNLSSLPLEKGIDKPPKTSHLSPVKCPKIICSSEMNLSNNLSEDNKRFNVSSNNFDESVGPLSAKSNSVANSCVPWESSGFHSVRKHFKNEKAKEFLEEGVYQTSIKSMIEDTVEHILNESLAVGQDVSSSCDKRSSLNVAVDNGMQISHTDIKLRDLKNSVDPLAYGNCSAGNKAPIRSAETAYGAENCINSSYRSEFENDVLCAIGESETDVSSISENPKVFIDLKKEISLENKTRDAKTETVIDKSGNDIKSEIEQSNINDKNDFGASNDVNNISMSNNDPDYKIDVPKNNSEKGIDALNFSQKNESSVLSNASETLNTMECHSCVLTDTAKWDSGLCSEVPDSDNGMSKDITKNEFSLSSDIPVWETGVSINSEDKNNPLNEIVRKNTVESNAFSKMDLDVSQDTLKNVRYGLNSTAEHELFASEDVAENVKNENFLSNIDRSDACSSNAIPASNLLLDVKGNHILNDLPEKDGILSKDLPKTMKFKTNVLIDFADYEINASNDVPESKKSLNLDIMAHEHKILANIIEKDTLSKDVGINEISMSMGKKNERSVMSAVSTKNVGTTNELANSVVSAISDTSANEKSASDDIDIDKIDDLNDKSKNKSNLSYENAENETLSNNDVKDVCSNDWTESGSLPSYGLNNSLEIPENVSLYSPVIKLEQDANKHESIVCKSNEFSGISLNNASEEIPDENFQNKCALLSTERHIKVEPFDPSLDENLALKTPLNKTQTCDLISSDLDFSNSDYQKQSLTISSKCKFRRHSFCDIKSLVLQIRPDDEDGIMKTKSISLPNFQIALNSVPSSLSTNESMSKMVDFLDNESLSNPSLISVSSFELPSYENSCSSSANEDSNPCGLTSDNSSTQGYIISQLSDSKSLMNSPCHWNAKISADHRKLLQKMGSTGRIVRKRIKNDCFCCSKHKPDTSHEQTACESCCKRDRPRKVTSPSILTLQASKISSFLKSHKQPVVKLTRLSDTLLQNSPTSHQLHECNELPLKNAVVQLERLEISSNPDPSSRPEQACGSSRLNFEGAVRKRCKLEDGKNSVYAHPLQLRSISPGVLHTKTVLKKSAPIIIDLTDSNSDDSGPFSHGSQYNRVFEYSKRKERNSSRVVSKKCRVVLNRVLL